MKSAYFNKNFYFQSLGLSFFVVSGYVGSFRVWGPCLYFTRQLDLGSLLLACFFLTIFSFQSFYLLIKYLSEQCSKKVPLFWLLKFILALLLWVFYVVTFHYFFKGPIEGTETFNYELNRGGDLSWGMYFGILLGAFGIYKALKTEQGLLDFIKFTSYLGLSLFIILIYRFGSEYKCLINNQQNLYESNGSIGRQVIWIVFDEFDPDLAFDSRLIKSKLVNFNHILNGAMLNAEMYPPGKNTITSVPSSLMGQPISERKKISIEGKLLFKDFAGGEFEFKNEGSVFDLLRKAGYDSSIFGFYHPYCKIFDTVDCVTYSEAPLSWYDGFARPLSRVITQVFPNQTYVSPIWGGDIASRQIADINAYISIKKHNLLYLHLMIPHLPAKYAQYYFGEKALNDHERYMLNIRLTDKVLGDILKAIPNDGKERLLILDSDHWFRLRDSNGAHRVLSIIKVMSDSRKNINHQPTSRIYTPDLVLNFLQGEINSNEDVLKYYSSKNYHGTHIPR